MGMFDRITCECPLPGLPDPSGIEFQTKDTPEQFLEEYRITAAGSLEIEEYDIEDRSDPNATGLMRIAGSMTRIHTGWAPSPFTGVLRFYGDANSGNLRFINFKEGTTTMLDDEGNQVPVPETEWFEYDAEFDNGKLISVERIDAAY